MSFNPPRTSDDRALAIKGDPGTATTDPKFYRDAKTITADGWNGPWDLAGAIGDKRLQNFWFQTKDARLGDLVSVILVLASDDTQVASFGECNVLMARDSSGWSPQDDKAARFQTSKLIPTGLKAQVKYFAAGTSLGNREFLYDWLVHE